MRVPPRSRKLAAAHAPACACARAPYGEHMQSDLFITRATWHLPASLAANQSCFYYSYYYSSVRTAGPHSCFSRICVTTRKQDRHSLVVPEEKSGDSARGARVLGRKKEEEKIKKRRNDDEMLLRFAIATSEQVSLSRHGERGGRTGLLDLRGM